MASVSKQSRHNGATHHLSKHIGSNATDLLNDGKKLVNEVYKNSLNKVDWAEETVKEASTKLVKKVKANPVASVLIAGGIGFLLSALLRK